MLFDNKASTTQTTPTHAQTQIGMQTKDRMRSNVKMEFVREIITANGQPFVMRAHLPIGKGFNEKGTILEWINMGWKTASEYDAEQNSLKAEAEREKAKAAEKVKK